MAGRYFCEYCSNFIPEVSRTEHNASHDYFSSESCVSCARVYNRPPGNHRDRWEKGWNQKKAHPPRQARSGKPLCAETHEHILFVIAKFVPRHCPICQKSFPVSYSVLGPGAQAKLRGLARNRKKNGKVFGIIDPATGKPAVQKYKDYCCHIKISAMYMAATRIFYADTEWVIDMIEEYQNLTGDSVIDEILAYSSPAFQRGLLRLMGFTKPLPFQPPLLKTGPQFAGSVIALPRVAEVVEPKTGQVLSVAPSCSGCARGDENVDWGLSLEITEVNAASIADFGVESYNGVYFRELPADAVIQTPVDRGIPVRKFFNEVTFTELRAWYTTYALVGNEVYFKPTLTPDTKQRIPTYKVGTYPIPYNVLEVTTNRTKCEQLLAVRTHKLGGVKFQTLYPVMRYPTSEVLVDIANAIKRRQTQ